MACPAHVHSLSRTQAAGKRRWVKKDGRRVQEVVRPGLISREMMQEWLKRVPEVDPGAFRGEIREVVVRGRS